MTEYLFHTVESPYLDRPNSISLARFTELLKTKNSPALVQVDQVYSYIVARNADPSYALAQFRWESQYGTAGHALVTKSWGNMLYDSNLTLNAVDRYSPGNGYTYAVYDDWVASIRDYIHYLYDYRDRRGLETIFDATTEWIGKPANDPWHIEYAEGICWDMAHYEWKTKKFVETGDEVLDLSKSFDSDTGKILTRYPLKKGTLYYKGTADKAPKTYTGNDTEVWFIALVNESTAWGVVKLQTGGKAKGLYIKNIDLNQITLADE